MDGNVLISQDLIQGIEATLNSIVFLVGITALVILIYAVISLLGNRRQARALEETRDIELSRLNIEIKKQRGEYRKADLPGGVTGWLNAIAKKETGEELDFSENAILNTRVMNSFPSAAIYAEDGVFLLTQTKPRILKKQLKELLKEGGKLATLSEESTFLDIMNKKAKEIRLSLNNAGHFFDIEAKKVAEELNINWDNPEILYLLISKKS